MLDKIFHEDCSLTLAKMPENHLDLVVTSPPYFNVKDYVEYESYTSYLDELRAIFTEVYRTVKVGRMVAVNISSILIPRQSRLDKSRRIPLPMHFVVLMEGIGFEFLEDIIWKKPEGSSFNRNGGFYRTRNPVTYKPNLVTEYIFVFQKPAPYLLDKIIRDTPEDIKNNSKVADGYERTNVWKINPISSSEHLAPYPEELVENLINYYSFIGDVVYDPFMGSGTTAVVAKKMGRRYIGSEIHAKYVDLANNRLDKILIPKKGSK